jgi:hypothetical protein
MPGRQTRAERAATPLARDAIRKIAEASGGCLRPVQLRRTDTVTGESVPVMVPCGATLASICPPCADRAKTLRAQQCRDGWHLEDEPDLTPGAPDEKQEFWLILRAEAELRRDAAAAAGQDTGDYDRLIGELDMEITRTGVRGTVTTHHTTGGDDRPRGRRSRSTRRRQDAAPLPTRKIAPRTVGWVYTAPDGKRYRPSMFITLTCDSYGKVNDDGTPADPAAYDYTRAARDAIHFAALFDRFVQNLRRVLGYEAQYFGGVEPQKRLAPHLHLAVRGSVPRPLLRQVLAAATYHQVWWPPRIRSGTRGTTCRSGMRFPATTLTPPPARFCRGGTRRWTLSARPISRGMWPGSARSSMRRGCSLGPRTPRSASGTSPSI